MAVLPSPPPPGEGTLGLPVYRGLNCSSFIQISANFSNRQSSLHAATPSHLTALLDATARFGGRLPEHLSRLGG